MAQVHLRGARYAVRRPAMEASLQAYCGLGLVEARALAERIVAGERVSVHMEDADAAYSLATELVELGVNAEADESDY